MSLRSMVGRAALALLVCVSCTSALAQLNPLQRGKQQAKPEQVSSLKGTIEVVGNGQLQISCGASEVCNVALRQPQKVRVTGTADRNYLGARMMVQFSAPIEKGKGRGDVKIKDPVQKLTIVTLNPPEIVAGALPDPSGGEGAQIIVGTIQKLNGTSAIVNVPGLSPKLKVEIPDSASIDVNVDLSYAVPQKGDGIEITKGMKFGTVIACMEGKITLTQPLVGRKKKGPGGLAHAKKTDDAADKPAASDASSDEKPKSKRKAKAKDDGDDKDKADKDK